MSRFANFHPVFQRALEVPCYVKIDPTEQQSMTAVTNVNCHEGIEEFELK
jgi:hypothetical protein